MSPMMLRFYRRPAFPQHKIQEYVAMAQKISPFVEDIQAEICYNMELSEELLAEETEKIVWLLKETFVEGNEEGGNFADKSFFDTDNNNSNNSGSNKMHTNVREIGPRLTFSTPWNSNALRIINLVNVHKVSRIERSHRYRMVLSTKDEKLGNEVLDKFISEIIDPMTECIYPKPIDTFELPVEVEEVKIVDILGNVEKALEDLNKKMGLGMDERDIKYYTQLFTHKLKRNPTDVECFDIAQSNSEHSRHWIFTGELTIDGEKKDKSLMDIVKSPLYNVSADQKCKEDIGNPCATKSPECIDISNSVIAFCDNASAQRGFTVSNVLPLPHFTNSNNKNHKEEEEEEEKEVMKDTNNDNEGMLIDDRGTGAYTYNICHAKYEKKKINYDVTFTAETHNFPCGVSPFPGAATGGGGRMRDGHAVGRGANLIAGTAGYCVGNLHINDEYVLPYEQFNEFSYPKNMAKPLKILIEASDGASDYGNKFGEPLINGFCRSFAIKLKSDKQRIEWVKPIMFSGGVGSIYHSHVCKGKPVRGDLIIKLGGPAYRVGIGGGAASSMIAGDNSEELDLHAVQRGDPEMLQKVNRVVRQCIELDDKNPIISIHDQGAGGNANVLKEIIEPSGGTIDLRKIIAGDNTLSAMELWGAEYQENDALLIRKKNIKLFDYICQREKCSYSCVGITDDTGYIKVCDSKDKHHKVVVNLPLEDILGKLPKKQFSDRTATYPRTPFTLPPSVSVREALHRVLSLLSVGSKRFLTSKVDRSVTGLVAQQQTVGPLQITLADCGVIGLSHFDRKGAAISIGEQPLKGLINYESMGRLSVIECITNIIFAKCTALENIKVSGNWMWAAKMQGELSNMFVTAQAAANYMKQIGIAIDGGKDSLSMACRDNSTGEVIKCPGELTISAYVTCEDITRTVTPDLKVKYYYTHNNSNNNNNSKEKNNVRSTLVYISLGDDSKRYNLGGCSLTYVYNNNESIGRESVDVCEEKRLRNVWKAIQSLLSQKLFLIAAGHDVSDGGLITAVLEMAFAGNCGVELDITEAHVIQSTSSPPSSSSSAASYVHPYAYLFNESPAIIMEVFDDNLPYVVEVLKEHDISDYQIIGHAIPHPHILVKYMGEVVLDEDMCVLRDEWERTSFELESLQCNKHCSHEEKNNLCKRQGHKYICNYTYKPTPAHITYMLGGYQKFKVAVIREEGSNGDREMSSAFYLAGFEVWDVTMTDLLSGKVDICEDNFDGVAFVGGFSYADVFDSAKGWAAVIKYNEKIKKQFNNFYYKKNTFSIGICNGCQLSALLGWTPGLEIAEKYAPSDLPRFIQNKSGRFESRWCAVRIEESKSIMLDGMAGSVLGVWAAHAEGKAHFPNRDVYKYVVDNQLVPITFVDENNQPTEQYPYNPNGSVCGIGGLCSSDGRHLCLMPHPERCFKFWQWGYVPPEWKNKYIQDANTLNIHYNNEEEKKIFLNNHKEEEWKEENRFLSPWIKMFQNARKWCEKQRCNKQ